MVKRAAIAILLTAAAVSSQTPSRFEVASVKKAESGGPPGDIPRNMETSPGTFGMRNVPMRYMMEWAFNLLDYEVEGPDWIKAEERYDIFAKAPGPATDDEMRAMLQALLLERFQMKIHRETRQLAAYVLLPGKGAPKFKESSPDSPPRLIPGKDGSVTFQHFGLSRLAFLLTRRMDHPALDQTGLNGVYDYTLNLSGLSEFSGPPNADPSGVVSIFAAVQQDLGLKLEPRKQQPVEVLVIDSANKVPIAN